MEELIIMFMELMYFIVFLFSTAIGAIVGLGGGVIIRPVLDVVAYHNVMNIAFLSSCAILTMAVVSTIKKVKDGTKIEPSKVALISLGALIGGIVGNLVLEHLTRTFSTEADVQRIQTAATIIVLASAVYFTNTTRFRYDLQKKALYPVLGAMLGCIAVFLGIGGGPINVPLFMILFSLPMKQATAYSIVVIFSSHLFRLITMGVTVGYGYFDLSFVPFIIPAAILGGSIGAMISKKLTDDTVKKLFALTMFLLIGVNVYNFIGFMA